MRVDHITDIPANTMITIPPCGTNNDTADSITIGKIQYPIRLRHLYESRFPFQSANILKTMYRNSDATVTQPRIIPKWSFPERSWKIPNAIRKRKGPERSASS